MIHLRRDMHITSQKRRHSTWAWLSQRVRIWNHWRVESSWATVDGSAIGSLCGKPMICKDLPNSIGASQYVSQPGLQDSVLSADWSCTPNQTCGTGLWPSLTPLKSTLDPVSTPSNRTLSLKDDFPMFSIAILQVSPDFSCPASQISRVVEPP